MTADGVHAPLDVERLRRARAGQRFGGTIHYFASIDSTNSIAARLAAEGAAEGTAVIAEMQTRGRGRLGRTWVSPPGRNLYLSVVLRPRLAVAAAPQLTLVAGLAAVEAVSDWVPRATIKWPNDVLIDERKVAGLLTEMAADGGGVRFVVLGIGVNLNSAADDFPAALRDKAASLSVAAGAPVDRVAFTERLLSRLEERYDLFMRAGFTAIRPLWEARSCLTGRRVTVADGDRRCAGLVTGIADDGSLCLRAPSGTESRVLVGDVTVIDGYAGRAAHSARSAAPPGRGS